MGNDEQDSGRKARSERTERDYSDLQNEIAERDVPRAKRFLTQSAAVDGDQSKRREKRERHSALMQRLMTDPAYQALYEETWSMLREAEANAEANIAAAAEILDQAKAELQEAQDNASTLPDGTRVFRTADGRVLDEDGHEIESDELDRITWRNDAPTYEEYLRRKQAVADAQAQHDAWLHYQTDVLGTARGRLTDQDNPLSPEELKEIQQQIAERVPQSSRLQSVDPTPKAVPDDLEPGSASVITPRIGA